MRAPDRPCPSACLAAALLLCACSTAPDPEAGLYPCARATDCIEGYGCSNEGFCVPADELPDEPADGGSGGADRDGGRADAGPRDGGGRPDAGIAADAGPRDGGSRPDAGTVDAGTVDAGTLDAGPPVWSNLSDAARWARLNVGGANARAVGWGGAATDGRYVYVLPNIYTVVARHDPAGSFGSWGSWALFDLASLGSLAKGCAGAAFDGRHLYLGSGGRLATRYDTQASFNALASWSVFDAALAGASSAALPVLAGRYVFFVGGWGGIATRYDREGAFTSTSSWTAFDLGALRQTSGFTGAALVGDGIYGVDWEGSLGRYDTRTSFSDPGSWTFFRMTSLNERARYYRGAATDGRWVYFAPDGDGAGPHGLVARHDASAPLGAPSSYEFFDLATKYPAATGYRGVVFDGRHVYFVPYCSAAACHHGLVVRYDTTAPFAAAGSWRAFDTTGLDGTYARGFWGGVFDGRYVYFAGHNYGPWHNGMVVRFDARFPPGLPPGWGASFF